MTENELKEIIPRRLGGDCVEVGLKPTTIDEAVHNAYRWFSEKMGVPKRDKIVLVAGKSDYPLGNGVKSVSNCYLPILPMFMPPFFDPIGIPPMIPLRMLGRARYSDLTLHLQYIEMIKRVVGADVTWDFRDGTLYLEPPPNQGGGTVYYDGYVELTDISQLDNYPSYRNLVVKYAVADAKELLGRIRSKYSEYPVAGGTIGLDGDRLLSEAREEKEKLEEEIFERGMPVPFLID